MQESLNKAILGFEISSRIKKGNIHNRGHSLFLI